MIEVSDEDRRRAFAAWLRTGWLLPVQDQDGVELKFNPWHDPADGRFTFAGAGSTAPTWPREQGSARRPVSSPGAARGPAHQPASGARKEGRPHAAVEFARGAAAGLSDTATGAAKGAYAALTTNPATTVRETGRAIAGTIDAAVVAEDTPARIQIARAAKAVENASAYDLGHAAGSTLGNVALVAVPEATLARASALRRLRAIGAKETFEPLQVNWVKENLGKDTAATRYNNGVDGGRRGEAPTLMRTMSDGSKRPVKFDGRRGDYLIDRKLGIKNLPRAQAQALRQSDVLAQHRSIGIWEVPDAKQKQKALSMLKQLGVTNIHVKVVKP